MAEKVADGSRQAGAEVTLYASDQFNPVILLINPAEFDIADAVAFGWPSMGVEELEDPMFSALADRPTGKTIGLFGSYGWGDGEWMRTWEANCRSLGAVLVCDGVTAQDAPRARRLRLNAGSSAGCLYKNNHCLYRISEHIFFLFSRRKATASAVAFHF